MPARDSGFDIHQWPASESRQGKNPRGWDAENAAHSAMGIWLMRKVRARECRVLRGGQGLRENGLVEGRDYVLELRWAEGHYERFPALAGELVDQGARVIIVGTIAASRAAQRATSVIPIVMASMNDPVSSGLVASLARPGGNTTGLATLNQDVTPKLVEFLRALLPKVTNIAVLSNPANPANPLYVESTRVQAASLGITVEDFAVKTPDELNTVFGAIAAKRPDALLVIPDAATFDLGGRIAILAMQHRIPIISTDPILTTAGGLISMAFLGVKITVAQPTL